MNLLFHPMIAISKAGRSNSAAAAGLQYCSAAVTVQGDKTAVLQQDCPATTVQQPLHVLQCRSDSMAVLHWRISCGIAVAGAGQEQRSRSSNTPPTVLCACKALTAHRPTCPCTMLAAAALSYLNPAVFTATKNRNSCAAAVCA